MLVRLVKMAVDQQTYWTALAILDLACPKKVARVLVSLGVLGLLRLCGTPHGAQVAQKFQSMGALRADLLPKASEFLRIATAAEHAYAATSLWFLLLDRESRGGVAREATEDDLRKVEALCAILAGSIRMQAWQDSRSL